ncbi:hypothetical protein K4F52_008349 [Lecanicillium sp. MT-2017a]|nr:hypothetical protein K4F52_008349 [Lecanicillium sp. MT-2017a]
MTHTIAFFGASAGCGLSALKRAVEDGHTCIAMCRKPEKMDAHFPSKPSNLIVKAGNAHDADSVAACLVNPHDSSSMVDMVHFSIGGAFNMKTWKIDDPDVCKKGTDTLLTSIEQLRSRGVTGRPLLVVVSTTGISKYGRDVPLLYTPLYHFMLKMPHADKLVMEERLVSGGERYILVRPSLLVDGTKPDTQIRVGVEDPAKGIEVKEVGYNISREDVGRWNYKNILSQEGQNKFEGKAISITW